jgi:acyl carrier protein
MSEDRYSSVFVQVFGLETSEIAVHLAYESIPEWDSVGHMSLIASLEDEFGIVLEMDDVIDFSSYAQGKELLKKYGVDL